MVLGNPVWLFGSGAPAGFWLYKNGVMETTVSGGMHATKIRGNTGTYDLVNANNVLTASVSYTSGTVGLSILYWTVNKIDISDFDTLHIYLDSVEWASESSSQSVIPRFGILSSQPGGGSDLRDSWFDKLGTFTTGSDKEYTLDLSNYSGSYYIGIGLFAGSAQPRRSSAVMSQIWLT